MTDRNANRPGYKRTTAGWIPEEWGAVPLSTAIEGIEAGTSTNGSDGPPCDGALGVLKVSAVTSGTFLPKNAKTVSGSEAARLRTSVKANTVLVNRANGSHDLVGSAVLVMASCPNLFLSDKLWQISVRQNTAQIYFVHAVLSSTRFRQCVIDRSSGGTGMMNIASGVYRQIPIPLPPLPEQNKIAAILSTWDEAIEQTRALIAAAKRRKKALMQQLLAGKQRLPGFKGKWPGKKLTAVTERITDSPASPDGYPVLSITAGTGFVSQADKFSKVIAGRHIEHYILLHQGEFAYNKGNSYRFPQGCAYRLREYEVGLVPDVFYSFRVKSGMIVPEFIEQFFLADLHGVQLRQWVNTGVRNNGLLNLNANDFFNLLVPVPELPEQRAIAAVLSTADEEIKSLEAKGAALERQKKGLLQKLLTGEVRVTP
jgi:type I restriction enzyme S subunit